MVAYTMKMLLRHAISFRYPRYDNQLYKVVKFFFCAGIPRKCANLFPQPLAQAYPKLALRGRAGEERGMNRE